MRKLTLSVAVLAMGLASLGCSDPHYGLKQYQIHDLRDWEAEGQHVVVEKKPETATVLGFFIGLGAFYTNEPVLGVVDLWSWPFSIIWEPWIAPGFANQINYEATQHAWERRQKKAEKP